MTLALLQSSITRTMLNNDNCKLCHIVATLLQRVMNQIDFLTKKTTKKYQFYGTADSVLLVASFSMWWYTLNLNWAGRVS